MFGYYYLIHNMFKYKRFLKTVKPLDFSKTKNLISYDNYVGMKIHNFNFEL